MLIVNLTIDVTLLFIGRERKIKNSSRKRSTAVYNKPVYPSEDSSPRFLKKRDSGVPFR